MNERPQTIEPMSFIAQELPNLIVSSDRHDLRGAAVAATYLKAQVPESRITTNLEAATEALPSFEEHHTALSDIEFPDSTKRIEKFALRSLAKAIKPLDKYLLLKTKAIALMSVAEYKVQYLDDTDQASVEQDFTAMMELTHGFSRSYIKGSWLERFYKNILHGKEQPTARQLAAADSARKVARNYSKNPGFLIDNFFDGWKARRLAKQIS